MERLVAPSDDGFAPTFGAGARSIPDRSGAMVDTSGADCSTNCFSLLFLLKQLRSRYVGKNLAAKVHFVLDSGTAISVLKDGN